MTDWFSKGYEYLLGACGFLAGATIAWIALMISVDVVARNLEWFNFPWLLEVSEYALYVSTFLGAPWVLHLNGHVRVDLLLTIVPRRIARRLEILADIAGATVSGVLLYYGYGATADAFRLGSNIARELVVAEWTLLMVIPISALLLLIEFLLRIRRTLAALPDEPRQSSADGP